MRKILYERDLYSPFIKKALSEGIAVYRIHDGNAGKKPFDIAGYWNNRPLAIEVKVLRDKLLPKSLFQSRGKYETHQLQWLNLCAKNKGVAIGMEYYTEYDSYICYALKHTTEHGQDIRHSFLFVTHMSGKSFESDTDETFSTKAVSQLLKACEMRLYDSH